MSTLTKITLTESYPEIISPLLELNSLEEHNHILQITQKICRNMPTETTGASAFSVATGCSGSFQLPQVHCPAAGINKFGTLNILFNSGRGRNFRQCPINLKERLRIDTTQVTSKCFVCLRGVNVSPCVLPCTRRTESTVACSAMSARESLYL